MHKSLDKPENKPAKFSLVNTSIDQFAVFEDNNASSDRLTVNSSISFGFDHNNGILTCRAEVDYIRNDRPLVRCAVSYSYKLHEETINEFTNGAVIVIPREILVYFGSKTYGGLRGVLLAKLENTSVRTVLPLTNLNSIITDSLTIETEVQGEDD